MSIFLYDKQVNSFYTGKFYNYKIFIYSSHLIKKNKNVYNCFIYKGHNL